MPQSTRIFEGKEKKLFDWMMLFYLVLIPLTRQVPYHQIVSYGGTTFLMILYLSRNLILSSDFRLPAPSFILIVLFYLITVLLSSLFSDHLIEGTHQLIREILFFLILFLVYDYIRCPRQWINIVHVLIFSGGIAVISVIISGLILFFSGEPLLGGNARVSGLFANPNVAGLLISVCFPVAIGYFQWKKFLNKKYSNIILLFVVFFTLAAAILTVSRGLILGFLFSMFFLHLDSIWKFRYKLLFILLILLFVSAVSGIILIDADMLASFNTSMRMDRGLAGRGFIWGRAWDIFIANPLLGTGPGTFLYNILSPAELRPYGTVESIRYMYFHHGDMSLMHVPGIFSGVISNSAHNLWLDTAANTGIIGVVAVALIFLVFGYCCIERLQVFRFNRQEPYYWVLKGCFVGLIAFFLRSQFEVSGLLRGALSESLPFWLTFLLVLSSPQNVLVFLKKRIDGN